jgi:hypothetical protein
MVSFVNFKRKLNAMASHLSQNLLLVILMLIMAVNSSHPQASSAAIIDAGAFHHHDDVTFFGKQGMSDSDIGKQIKRAKNEQVAAPQQQDERAIHIKNKDKLPSDLQTQLEQLARNQGKQYRKTGEDTTSNAIVQIHKAHLLIDQTGTIVAVKVEGGTALSRFVFLRDHCLKGSYSEPMGDVRYGYLKKEGSARTKALKAGGEQIEVLDVTFLD